MLQEYKKGEFLVCKVKILYQVFQLLFCITQNPTAISYLPAIGLVSCNMAKEQIKLSHPAKDGSYFCTPPPSIMGEYARSGSRTLSIFPDTPT